MGAEVHQSLAVPPVSFTPPLQATNSAPAPPSSSSHPSGEDSFAAHLKRSSPSGEDRPAAEAARPSKQAKDKSRTDESEQNPDDKSAAVPVEVRSPQAALDPRSLFLNWPKDSAPGSGNTDKTRAAAESKAVPSAASPETSHKSPLVFAVNLQKGDKQQHSDTSDSDAQPAPAKNGSSPLAANSPSLAAPHVSGSPAPLLAPSPQQVQAAYVHNRVTPPAAPAAPSQIMNSTELPPTPVSRSQTIDLKIAGADNTQVDVRVSQRAGDVQVTVRTADSDLAQSLRQHLPELSDRLAQSGVHGDIWQPAAQSSSHTGAGNSDHGTSDHPPQQQQQQQERDARHGAHPDQQQHRQSAWLDEFNTAERKGH